MATTSFSRILVFKISVFSSRPLSVYKMHVSELRQIPFVVS